MRRERVLREIEGVAYHFGEVDFDDEDLTWVCIRQFPVPKGWNQAYSPLLIWLPPDYPARPPLWFEVHQDLQDQHGRSVGRRLAGHQREGWFRFCYYLRKWQPSRDIVSGDNLVSVGRLIYEVLKPQNM